MGLSDPTIDVRKVDHLRLSLLDEVDMSPLCRDLYDEIRLVHKGLPGINYEDVELGAEFLGYKLRAPLVITGITGGPPATTPINEKLAALAEEFGIGIGVGSQRAMLVNRGREEVLRSYKVVREIARDVPVIGNIGANTLQDLQLEDIIYLVESIGADALAIHLNPAQELVQPEGDTRFSSLVLDKIAEIRKGLGKPLIIKEVGFGLSMEVVKKFHDIGIRIFDVAGACGTNWAVIESYRHQADSPRSSLASILKGWGIPTPLSVIEARWASPGSTVIASGGVWNGLLAAKNIALGADLVGFARPVLKALLEGGPEAARKFLAKYIEELRAAMFLTGSRSVSELKRAQVVIGDRVARYLEMRGIDRGLYFEIARW